MSFTVLPCSRGCGQLVPALDLERPYPVVCSPCRELERQPQGERVKLFEPAPEQLPGQESLL